MTKVISEDVKFEVRKFLQNNHVMVLASISENVEPEAATIYYVCDDDFNFYFLTSSSSKKAENLHANGKVAVVVGQGPQVVTVQAGGEAKEVKGREAEMFYEMIKKVAIASANEWPILSLAKEGYCTFKITPKWLTYFNLDKENFPEIASEQFYKII